MTRMRRNDDIEAHRDRLLSGYGNGTEVGKAVSKT